MNNNTKLLKTLIEGMVAKEVKKQLPILLQELLGKGDDEQEPSQPPMVKQPTRQPLQKNSLMELLGGMEQLAQNAEPVAPKVTKTYTKNPMINAILNETVNDLSVRESGRAPSVALDGMLSMNSNSEEGLLNESVHNIPQQPTGPAESVLDFKGKDAAVDKIMNFDFKAILAKSKTIKR